VGETGFSSEAKFNLVRELSNILRFLFHLKHTPEELEKFRLPVSPEKLHDVLYYSALYIGEGATTASECTMLGTPAIYVNSLSAGTLEEQERQGLLYGFRNSEGVLEKALEIINTPDFKVENRIRRNNMLKQTIDVTAFMVWFVENYPGSVKIMKGESGVPREI